MRISRPCAANSNSDADTEADPRLLALRCPKPTLVLFVALLALLHLWSLLASLQRSFIMHALELHSSINFALPSVTARCTRL